MKSYLQILLIFLSSAFASISEAQLRPVTYFNNTLSEKLDEYLESCASAYHFNGSVLIARKGETVLQKGYGYTAKHQLIVTADNDKLFVEASNPNDRLPKVELHAESVDRFYINEAPLKFEFLNDAQGDPIKMITYNTHGKDAEWMKIK